MTHPVDRAVGQNLRKHRVLVGMTQQQLATKIGIRFQQVQKYESGMNRISASRLWDISVAMNVPVSEFFRDCDANRDVADPAGSADVPQTRPRPVVMAAILDRSASLGGAFGRSSGATGA